MGNLATATLHTLGYRMNAKATPAFFGRTPGSVVAIMYNKKSAKWAVVEPSGDVDVFNAAKQKIGFLPVNTLDALAGGVVR